MNSILSVSTFSKWEFSFVKLMSITYIISKIFIK